LLSHSRAWRQDIVSIECEMARVAAKKRESQIETLAPIARRSTPFGA